MDGEERKQLIDKYRLVLSSVPLESTDVLMELIEAEDPYTQGHSLRVADYSEMIAIKAGLSETEVKDIRYEAVLHDIGKIGICDEILSKPYELSDEEYASVQKHTIIGAYILSDIDNLPWAKYVAKYHHERYDGKGYPDGLRGEEIPLHARIVAIADAYDAMNTDRAYRKSLSASIIKEELEKGKGTQFDPDLTELF